MGSNDDEQERRYSGLLDRLSNEPREQRKVSNAASSVPPPPGRPEPPRPPTRWLWWRLPARLLLLALNGLAVAGAVLGVLHAVATTDSFGKLSVMLAPGALLGAIAGALGLAGFVKDGPIRAPLLLASALFLFAGGAVGLLTEPHGVSAFALSAAAAVVTLDARVDVQRGAQRLVPLTVRSYLLLAFLGAASCTAYGACFKHKRPGSAQPSAQEHTVDGG